jgi:hypothetical protein
MGYKEHKYSEDLNFRWRFHESEKTVIACMNFLNNIKVTTKTQEVVLDDKFTFKVLSLCYSDERLKVHLFTSINYLDGEGPFPSVIEIVKSKPSESKVSKK